MSTSSIGLDDALTAYVHSTLREAPILKRLREETAALPMAMMQISPEQGAFMALLVELLGAKRTIEVGTFTGYSALAVAFALPADGRVTACDVSEEWTAVARRYWREAKVDHKITLTLAPATKTLDELIAGGQRDLYDFAFIDADKPNYDAYYERCLTLVRPGGLIAIDNVLWGGSVADPKADDADTRAIRALNIKITGDKRVTASLVPIGDGLTLARKR
jgi:predicted O-methyltransferase YrrM